MHKISFAVAIVATAAACPAYAADLCTDAHMKQMDKLIAEMTDPTKQKEERRLSINQRQPWRRAIKRAACST